MSPFAVRGPAAGPAQIKPNLTHRVDASMKSIQYIFLMHCNGRLDENFGMNDDLIAVSVVFLNSCSCCRIIVVSEV
jgi:hypothetical protein